ncbi:hypothetical protein WICPIJ_000906 [Wickerhamomyces pijperi]|uniref:C2H2-type domain-containing protein n=1 Tax=Wickerhamomyces pijperi TaxID=599730 RepID=A0A9P8QF30_WICPI|nr:hypothetical protein WICPIJ_000906 [Wickerhamomyces pijperi]
MTHAGELITQEPSQINKGVPSVLSATLTIQNENEFPLQDQLPLNKPQNNEEPDRNVADTQHENEQTLQASTSHTVPSTNDLDDTTAAQANGSAVGEEGKPVSCPHCNQTFTRSHNLKSHMLIHTGDKLFNCSVCSNKFRRLHDLKRHEKLHTGEKPYGCGKCGRKFARADALVRHANSQTGCALLIESGLSTIKSTPESRKLSISSSQDADTNTPSHAAKKPKYETNHWKVTTLPPPQIPQLHLPQSSLLTMTPNTTKNEDSGSGTDLPTLVDNTFQFNKKENQENIINTSLNVHQDSTAKDINTDVYNYINALEQRIFLLESKVNQLTQLQSLNFQTQSIQRNLQNSSLNRNVGTTLSNLSYNVPNITSTPMGFMPGILQNVPLKSNLQENPNGPF